MDVEEKKESAFQVLQSLGTEVQEKACELKDGCHRLSFRNQFKENGRGRNLEEKIFTVTNQSP